MIPRPLNRGLGTSSVMNPRSSGTYDQQKYLKYSQSSLQREASELQRCAALCLRTSHVLPLKVLSYDAELNVLCTERVVGDNLFNILWNNHSLSNMWSSGCKGCELTLDRMEELGVWLSQYHKSSLAEAARSMPAEWLDQSFGRKLQLLADKHLLKAALCERVYSCKTLLREVFETDDCLDICQIHGDFTPHNVFRDTSENVRILDFGDSRRGYHLEDVVRFWELLWSMAHASRARQHHIIEAGSKFLRGYGLDPAIIHTKSFVMLRVYNVITNYLGFHASKHYLSYKSQWLMWRITKESMRWLAHVSIQRSGGCECTDYKGRL